MDSEVRKKYEKAQSISEAAQEFAKNELKEGVSILTLGEKVENEILKNGGNLAFPINISINEIAAHYTPDINDKTILKEGDLVKIDVGVHIDGYIWDAAFSRKIGKEKDDIIKSSEQALEAALKIIKPGVRVFEISEVVESTVESFGLKVIENLSGHGLERFVQHAHPSIPNARNKIQHELEEGHAVAMEVFTTDGAGYVKEGSETFIYRYIEDKNVRLPEARKILAKARDDFQGMPFATRWVQSIATGTKLVLAFRELVQSGAIHEYPILKEAENGKVAQTETTVLL
jgi:methionyl aminopeptidase